MKRVQRAGIVALLTLACSPVYHFSYPQKSGLPAAESIAGQLAEALRPRGYTEIELTPGVPAPMSGDSGAYSCPDTGDYHVFERNLRSPGYSGVTVHVYECGSLTRIAIVSSSGAEHEAREVRDLIQAELSAEIERGAVKSDKRHRIVLE